MTKKEKIQLKEIILYIIFRLGRKTNRTRLIKLLYLADLSSKKQLGKKISALKYDYYYYGPFSREVLVIIDELKKEKKILESETEGDRGGKFFAYILSSTIDKRDIGLKSLSQKKKRVLDNVLKEYGNMEFNRLIDKVYETKPIRSNPQGKTNIL